MNRALHARWPFSYEIRQLSVRCCRAWQLYPLDPKAIDTPDKILEVIQANAVPTFTLSYEDCQQMAAAISLILAPLEDEEQTSSDQISPDTMARIEGYTRIRNLLNSRENVGTFSPTVALNVLNDLANNTEGMTILFRQPNRSQEETDQAIRLQACKILDGHRDQYGVQASKLTHNGGVLREFLRGWNDPIVPLDVVGPRAITPNAGDS
jgi:hypothetical protein